MPRAIATLLAVAALWACGGPGVGSPSPGGFGDVIAQLVLRGVTVHEHVSGDPGCAGSPLHSNALRLTVSLAGDTERRDVYLFRWRRQADYESAAATFGRCLSDFGATQPNRQVRSLEISPWRAYGAGWSEALAGAVEGALTAAS